MGRRRLLEFALSLALTFSFAPAAASAETAFDTQMRAARALAAQRVMTTEKHLKSGQFTYYAAGSAWTLVDPNGWTSGFFPGELWQACSLTGDSWFADRGAHRIRSLKPSILTASSTDIGMRFFYSHAKAYQMTGSTASRGVVYAAAGAEAARFDPTIGAIRSLPGSGTGEVIVDELMNLEVLYWGAENGGPITWLQTAQTHARTVARDFVRPDGSVHHIMGYDPITGMLVDERAGQGYSADSMWARGQAWAIHGFTNSYRHTGDPVLLDAARKVADRYLLEVPPDMVPYWDFRAPDIPDEPRDSSAAAIAASGLIDLALLDPVPANRLRYAYAARATLVSLSSPAYFSAAENPAILLHGTVNYWSGIAVDVGQSYGDYFFLEALQRLRRLPPDQPTLAVRGVKASAGKPKRAVDRKPSSAWTSSGKQWIEFDLGRRRQVSAVSLAFASGDSRSAKFKVYVSSDRKKWQWVSSARSSAETLDPETYTFAPKRARYVRIVCTGTSRGKANGVSEALIR